MAGQPWKYDTIVGLWHQEDGLDSKGNNDITLSGTVTVPGKLDNAQSFTLNDFGVSDGLITSLASVTKGTIAGWIKVDNSGTVQTIFSCTKTTGIGASTHKLEINSNMLSRRLDVFITIGGSFKLRSGTPTGSLTPFVGTIIPYVIDHDGTKITRMSLNNVDQTITRFTTTDETVWFADVIAAGADTCSWGSSINNSIRTQFLNADLDETMINSELWDADDRADFWNGGAGQIITEPPILPVAAGIATAENNGLQGIDVSMPYTNDRNNDSTYTVDYRVTGDVAWTNWVTEAPNTPSPFLTTILGLADGNTYEVRVTYIDPDGVTGDNPQIITGIFMPIPVVPIITTHNQDAKNRLLEQYKKEPGIEGLIESYFGNQIQDLEDVLQLFFDRLNIDISEGVQLNGIGKIVNQDRLGLTDEIYRLFLKGRIGANVSEGDIERLIGVWKTITQANIVKLEEIFPAEVNLATDIALPENLIDIAFALIQNVSGAGIGVGITTFLPEDAFSFEGADPAITKGFGELISIGTTDGTTVNKLVDSGADFVAAGVVPGMVAMNDTDGTEANVVSVDVTELTLDADIFVTGEDYYINANTGGKLAKIQGAN